MARSALDWSLKDLADACGLSEKTIRRLESERMIQSTTVKTLTLVKSTLEAAGIEFLGTPDDRPGIRIGLPSPKCE
ncbi:helix-turn-helix domain-containing protein [Rhodobacterales bacterium LSUCC0031]|nr:helix-turn-helix domain-containing protein [Rhodobacterales bacterium LSUCC0031]